MCDGGSATVAARGRLGRTCAHLGPRHRDCSGSAAAGTAADAGLLPLPPTAALVDGRSGQVASFGVEVTGLDPTQLQAEALPVELCSALRLLLAQRQVVVCRFDGPLTVAQMQGVISLFGQAKGGQARCQDGSTRQYLRYDHPGIADHLRGTGIMEHRSGLVLTPEKLSETYSTSTNKLLATGGTSTRPFVYEGFHTVFSLYFLNFP